MKNLFDGGVIISALRRIKTLGIIAGILAFLQVIFSMTGTVIFGNFLSDMTPVGKMEITQIPVESNVVLGALPTICVIGAIIMTLVALSFLNSRSSCDFYHALPQRRETVYISSILAVVCMIGMIAVSAGLLAMLIGLIFSMFISFNYGTLALIVLNCIIAALLASAASALAMSITGTTFSNIIMSAIIIFLPQMLTGLFTGCVSISLPRDLISANALVDSYKCLNLAAGFMSANVLTDGWASLYSFVLAIGYIALGCLFYKRRASEMAGVSAPSRRMQAIYRILIGFAMFSLITAGLFLYTTSQSGSYLFSDDTVAIFLFVIAYVTAAVLYFVFELIMTKKWKNVARAIPGLGIVILLSAAMFGGMTLVSNAEIGFSPKAEEINAISFENNKYQDESSSWSSYYGTFYLEDVYLADLGEYKTDDPEAIKIISKNLSKEVKKIQAGDKPTSSVSGNDGSGIVEVNIYSGGLRKTRMLYLNPEEFKIVGAEKQKCIDRLYDDVTSLSVDTSRCDVSTYYPGVTFTPEQEKRILDTFNDEIKGISLRQWSESDDSNLSRISADSMLLIEYTPKSMVIDSNTYGETFISRLLIPEQSQSVTMIVHKSLLPKTYAVFEDILGSVMKASQLDLSKGYAFSEYLPSAYVNATSNPSDYREFTDKYEAAKMLKGDVTLAYISTYSGFYIIDEKMYTSEAFAKFIQTHFAYDTNGGSTSFELFTGLNSSLTEYTAQLNLSDEDVKQELEKISKQL